MLKCGFPLAQEWKKRKTFFLHMAGSLGTGVRRVLAYMAYVRFQYLFCHSSLPGMPHLPMREVLVECAKWRRNYSLAIVIVRQALWFGLPWRPVVWEANFMLRYHAMSWQYMLFCICPKFLNYKHKVTRTSTWSVSIWVFAKFQLNCTERPSHDRVWCEKL